MDTLQLLIQQGEERWLPWQQKRPLLQIACERGAFNCVRFLASERSEEINQCYDEYYPIHQAALHNIKFLDLLIKYVYNFVKFLFAVYSGNVYYYVFMLIK